MLSSRSGCGSGYGSRCGCGSRFSYRHGCGSVVDVVLVLDPDMDVVLVLVPDAAVILSSVQDVDVVLDNMPVSVSRSQASVIFGLCLDGSGSVGQFRPLEAIGSSALLKLHVYKLFFVFLILCQLKHVA